MGRIRIGLRRTAPDDVRLGGSREDDGASQRATAAAIAAAVIAGLAALSTWLARSVRAQRSEKRSPDDRPPSFVHPSIEVPLRTGPHQAAEEAAGRALIERARPGGALYWGAVILLALLAAAGVAAIALRVFDGDASLADWGYPAATLAFVLSTAQAAPTLAFATRLARGYWATPLRRVAELFALAGIVAAPLHLILLLQLPDFFDRPSIWFNWPGAPLLWDAIATILLAALGLVLLYLGALPDLAAARDLRRSRLAGRLALGWRGNPRQWRVLDRSLIALGGLYLMIYTFVHLVVSSDMALSLVPGWSSASIPPYHAISGFEGGVAATLLALAVLRRSQAVSPYTGVDTFHSAGKILLALALLFFYFTWAEFLTYWYSRTPEEKDLMLLLMFGPYLSLFVASLGLSFVVPLLILMWNPLRSSVRGPVIAAASVLIGLYVDRIRMYVAAWSVAGPVRDQLGVIPSAQLPTVTDTLILVGVPALVLLLFALALRILPGISLWESKAHHLLRTEERYIRTTVPVLGKPS